MNKLIIVIANIFPEPSSSAAGQRIVQLIQCLLSLKYKIEFWSENNPNVFSYNFSALNIQTEIVSANDSEFDKLIVKRNPAFVIYDRFTSEEKFGWRIANLLPKTIRILDSEDLHFLRDFRLHNYQSNSKNYSDIEMTDIFQREIASMYRSDLVLTISEFEMEFLTKNLNFPKELLHYFPILNEETEIDIPIFENRQDFCFIGNFYHKPNVDCVVYLKEIIWPLIKVKLPNSKIYIYGAYPNQSIINLQDENLGFIIKGRVKVASEVFLKHKVLLAPLRFGAGLKGKLIESMQFGIPTITSKIGMEGIAEAENWNGFVTDDPQQFANSSVSLYQNKGVWLESQIKGYRILKAKFDKSLFLEPLKNRLIFVQHNLDEIRIRNYFGAILLRNQNLATKYMSKWIEEKNKKS